MVGRCKGSGVIAVLIPVIVGYKYRRTLVESLLCVQPRGFIVVTNCRCGVYGSVSDIR
jgi:hypothetical protein